MPYSFEQSDFVKNVESNYVESAFDENNDITNKKAFLEGMYNLLQLQNDCGFENGIIPEIHHHLCRAAEFKNVEVLEQFSKALPGLLTKETWISVPQPLMDLPVYPSKEHRAQDAFQKYTAVLVDMAKGEYNKNPPVFLSDTYRKIRHAAENGCRSEGSRHRTYQGTAKLIPIVYGYGY